MKILLLFLILLINYSNVWAQDSTLFTIKAGSSIRDVLKTTDIFYYPQFISGQVFFRDGTKSTAKLNYNRLFDQILFINPNRDTLALTDEKTIKFITLEKDTFYYYEGYVRLVASNRVIKLAEKQNWEVADVRKMGAHNSPSTTFAIASISTLIDIFGKSHELILNEDVILRKITNYYFGDVYNRFVPASKKNLLSLFPKEQKRLANYLKENKVNFTKKNDVEKLTQFLEQSY